MKIPKKIKVGAEEFTIEFLDKINEQDDLGETRHSDGTIKIKKMKNRLAVEATFIHELCHTLAHTFNETEIEFLSNRLHSFIKDNPGVLK